MRDKSTERPVPTKIGVAVVRLRLNISSRSTGGPLRGVVAPEPRLREPITFDRPQGFPERVGHRRILSPNAPQLLPCSVPPAEMLQTPEQRLSFRRRCCF